MSEVEQWKNKILLTVSLNITIISYYKIFFHETNFFLPWFQHCTGGSFQKGLISIWIKLIKVIIFTFIVEIIFLLRLCHMFEHIYIYFFLHNSKEESNSKWQKESVWRYNKMENSKWIKVTQFKKLTYTSCSKT